ncbi:MAG: ROK family transcriptional regulator [Verrucomicrobiota bacterium]
MNLFDNPWPFSQLNESHLSQLELAEKNRIRVLGSIVFRKFLSQRQLAAGTKLQASTISNIIRDLKKIGLVFDGESIEAERVGPKETIIEISSQCVWSIGLQLEPNLVRIIVLNAQGHTLTQQTLPPGITTDAAIQSLPEKIKFFSDTYGLDLKRFGGIGVSIPGVVDAEKGTVLVSRPLKMTSRPLRSEIETLTGYPVWIDRNVVCGAYAEYCQGAAKNRESFIYFFLLSNPNQLDRFGMAILIGDQIFRGCNYAAGEVDYNLLSDYFSKAKENEKSPDALYQACAESFIGFINLLDISSLVFASNDPDLTDERFQKLSDKITSGLVPVPGRKFNLLRSGIGVDGMLLGSGLLALHKALAEKVKKFTRNT